MKPARALTILVTLIGIVAACTVTTDNKETPVTSAPGPPDPREFSLLTDEGVRQIKDSQRARFDLRDLTLTNTEAGLPANHKQDVIIGGAGKPDIELSFLGPEAGDTVNTQTIWITTHFRGGQFEDLIFWRSFDTIEGAQQELAQAPHAGAFSRRMWRRGKASRAKPAKAKKNGASATASDLPDSLSA